MTVQLKPETERLVDEEIKSGHFQSVDELIVQGVQAWRERHQPSEAAQTPKKNFAQFLMESPLPGSGLKLERQK